jgi:hypothetical protein
MPMRLMAVTVTAGITLIKILKSFRSIHIPMKGFNREGIRGITDKEPTIK